MQNRAGLQVSGSSSHATPEFHTFSWMKPRGFSDFAPEQTRKLLRAVKSFSGLGSHLVLKREVQVLVLIQGEEGTELCSLTWQVTVLNIERSLSNFTWNSTLDTRYYSNECFHRANHFCLSNHHFLSIPFSQNAFRQLQEQDFWNVLLQSLLHCLYHTAHQTEK